MNPLYQVGRLIWKFIFIQTMRMRSINREVLRRRGGYILAVTHISHLEVVCAGMMTCREIHWVTRKEFYCNSVVSLLLKLLGCIRVNRQGIPVSTIRTAARRAAEGRIIGIFPEGGVVWGEDLAVRGGAVKKGMCSIAIHGGVPIIPCVIIGTHKLLRVRSWLPFARTPLWLAFGEPISPPAHSTRQTRQQMADEVRSALQKLYGQMQERFGIRDVDVP